MNSLYLLTQSTNSFCLRCASYGAAVGSVGCILLILADTYRHKQPKQLQVPCAGIPRTDNGRLQVQSRTACLNY